MQLLKNCYKRGDTIIEVLFGISIFSLVAVGGLAIMNKGTAVAQRALEITLVRQQIDAQAETLRFLNSSYIAAFKPSVNLLTYASGPFGYDADTPEDQWATMVKQLIDDADTAVSPFSDITTGGACPTVPPNKSFIMNTKTAKYIKTGSMAFRDSVSFSQVRYENSSPTVIENTDGIWIEAVRKPDVSSSDDWGYIDFHIRACWSSVGQSLPVTLGTIVRLYEPRP